MSTDETDEHLSQQRLGRAVAYSAHVQDAMRFGRLHSADYPLVMSVMRALSQGYGEEQWKEEQQQVLTRLASRSGSTAETPPDVTEAYAQLVTRLKDLTLWPW